MFSGGIKRKRYRKMVDLQVNTLKNTQITYKFCKKLI